jgi:hypothetical protein
MKAVAHRFKIHFRSPRPNPHIPPPMSLPLAKRVLESRLSPMSSMDFREQTCCLRFISTQNIGLISQQISQSKMAEDQSKMAEEMSGPDVRQQMPRMLADLRRWCLMTPACGRTTVATSSYISPEFGAVS